MGGANGKILESKAGRDNRQSQAVSITVKALIWGFILLTLGGMLFYVYLFAMRQTASRQSSWFKTFLIWLMLELLLVSSAIVLVTHVMIPSFVLDELKQIREKTVAEIRAFREAFNLRIRDKRSSLLENGENTYDTKLVNEQQKEYAEEITTSTEFNAAKYLFVSNRVARAFPTLPISGSVLSYSTQWPQQSMTNEKHLGDNYNSKFNFIIQSASRIVYFLLLSIIQFPEPVQDCIIEMVSTSGLGYCVVLLVTLHEISPFVVIVPVAFLAMSIHFIITSSKSSFLPAKEKESSSRISPESISAAHQDLSIPSKNDLDDKSSQDESNPILEMRDSDSLYSWTGEFDVEAFRNLEQECSEEIADFISSPHHNKMKPNEDSHILNFDVIDGDSSKTGENRKSVESYSENSDNDDDSCQGDADNNQSRNDIILAQYQQIFDDADNALRRLSTHFQSEEPSTSFEHSWEENSDEYKYLYMDDITPFVDKYGNNISTSDIVERRLKTMKCDIDLYQKNKGAAKAWAERRQRDAIEWDDYRLYESALILPFVNTFGQYYCENTIKKLRNQRKALLSLKDDNESPDGDLEQFRRVAKPLYEAKQLAEYDLMVYTKKLRKTNKVHNDHDSVY